MAVPKRLSLVFFLEHFWDAFGQLFAAFSSFQITFTSSLCAFSSLFLACWFFRWNQSGFDKKLNAKVDEYAEHLEPLIPLSPELKPGVVRGDLKFTTSNFETSLAGSSGPDSQEIPRQPQIVFAYPEAGDGESQEGSPTRPETTEFPQTVVSKTAHLRYWHLKIYILSN